MAIGCARWLSQWLRGGDRAGALDVPVKRHLCAVDAGYFVLLGRIRSHAIAAGRPDDGGQATAFESLPHARDAVAVRRWDDQAKDPAVSPPRLAHFAPLLEALARSWRDSALTAVELCTLNATALPR